eukprot:TRINITY_DN12750_c0_g1_i1.p1 TRINITY_DN12750_c0_g1~~TRINITY_DN12750_c0_g1_i1.p1  ORF type:complete len:406 (+),score=123.63 TRINITY_DN12750_c0_g1_i1:121-1338(+)
MKPEKQAQLVKNDKLLQACRDGCIETVKAAIDNGAQLQHAGGVFGETPLHAACAKGSLSVVKILVESGADVRARCERNNTPLHEAAFSNHINIVKWMLANTSCRLLAKNVNGMTPERSAKSQRHHKCAELLKKAAEARKQERSMSPQRSKEPSQSPTKKVDIDSELVAECAKWLTRTTPPITTWSELHQHTSLLSKVLPLLQTASSSTTPTTTPCTQNELLAAMFSVPQDVIATVIGGNHNDNQCQDTEPHQPEQVPAQEAQQEPEPEPKQVQDQEHNQEKDTQEEVVKSPPTPQQDSKESVGAVVEQKELKDDTPPTTGEEQHVDAAANPVDDVVNVEKSPSPVIPEVTESEKVQPATPEPVPAAVVEQQEDDGEEWECQLCHMSNISSKADCEVCDKPRGSVP